MSAIPEIRTVLARAFERDPLMEWFFPDPVVRPTALAAWMGLFAEAYLRDGAHDLARDAGGALTGVALTRPAGLVISPGGGAGTLPEAGPLFAALAGQARADDVREAFASRQGILPEEPADYLHMLAVHPTAQGTGTGTALLRAVRARAAGRGLPVHLETTNPRARALYEREGFVVTGTVVLARGGPRMWGLRTT